MKIKITSVNSLLVPFLDKEFVNFLIKFDTHDIKVFSKKYNSAPNYEDFAKEVVNINKRGNFHTICSVLNMPLLKRNMSHVDRFALMMYYV